MKFDPQSRIRNVLLFELVQELRLRLIRPVLMVAGVFVGGTTGYMILGRGKWSLLDAMYMTSITLTTVGYGEVLEGMDDTAVAFTMVLMWTGMAVTLFAISEVTAFVVDRNLGRLIRERRMQKEIDKMNGHYVIVGAGQTGIHIVQECYTTKRPMVVIEHDGKQAEFLHDTYPGVLVVEGDATEEAVLIRAGLERASGVIANVHEDSQNLLITVQAKFINPKLTVVARIEDARLNDKVKRAGADYVVNPTMIGGMRMASQMIRPNTVTFLDRMLRGQDPSVRVDEAIVHKGSKLENKPLVDSGIFEKTGLRAIALQPPSDTFYHYNPSGSEVLEAGTLLIIVGSPDQLERLRELCEAPKTLLSREL